MKTSIQAPSLLSQALLDCYAVRWAGTKNEEHALAVLERFSNFWPNDALQPDLQSRVDAYCRHALTGKKGSTWNRHRAYLTTAFKYLHARGWIQSVPDWPRRPESPNRERVLTKQELAAVLGRMSPRHHEFAALLVNTGLRLSEALACVDAQRLWVADGRRMLVVEDSKSGRSRAVPLNPRALEAWDKLRAGEIVKRTFQRDFAEACKACNLEGVVVHSLRHTFATNLAAAGVPLNVVQRLLGHSSIVITMRYAHASDQQAQAAVETLK